MPIKITDPMGKAMIEFMKSQGAKFVDAKTGEELDLGGEEDDEKRG